MNQPVIWEAPGPGAWELDATHRGRRPMTPFVRETLLGEVPAGSEVLMERYGLQPVKPRVAP